MAETELTSAAAPAIAYEYIWFAGQPLAQIETATNTIHYYFNDHLGTPLLTTSASGAIDWRVEREPYGRISSVRVGTTTRHQPLAFPGQEDGESADRSYNIFRWYRSGWGRYTQADPVGLRGGLNAFLYSSAKPLTLVDPYGLVAWMCDIGLLAGGEVGGGGVVDISCTSKDCVAKKKKKVSLRGVIGGFTFGLPVGYSDIEVEIEDNEPAYVAENLAGEFVIHAFSVALISGAGYAEIQMGKGKGTSSGWDWGAGFGASVDNFWGHVEIKWRGEECCK